MNCQDIRRLVDTGSFSQLSEAERDTASAHARTCPHCAPVWAAHSELAQMEIPPMPAELAGRVRTLASLPAMANGAPRWRRLTLVGCVVAVAAAAALLVVNETDTQAPGSQPAAATVVTEPAPTAATGVVSDAAPTADTPDGPVEAKSLAPLPLLLAPVDDFVARRNARSDLALQKAVEAHPELVEGPDLAEVFAAGVVIREDGTLLASAVKLAASLGDPQATADIERALPKDGGLIFNATFPQHELTLDGRALRAQTRLRVVIVRRDYDLTRSNVRVLQILGDRYADLMMPATSRDTKLLTVLLSDDGRVLREQIDNAYSLTGNGRLLSSGDSDDVSFLAQSVADKLEVDVAEIGLMGGTSIEDGVDIHILEADGTTRREGNQRVLYVSYAWQRRASDPGPVWGQKGPDSNRSQLDLSAAQRIAERMIPDVLTAKDRTAGEPYIVLSVKGEVIAAGRLKIDRSVAKRFDDIIREGFDLPDFWGSDFETVRLRNNLGEQADVIFAWDLPEETKASLKEAAPQ